jgi:leucyl-tRNA synthetase
MKMEQKRAKYPLELNTMPGFAGSSAYYLRYEDPRNDKELVSKEANDYWGNVDLYVGGTEHATGHLIYSRFWNKFLHDLGYVKDDEPFQKLINQGMIQGRSSFVYRFAPAPINLTAKKLLFVSNNIRIACENKKQEYLSNKCTIEELVSFVANEIDSSYFSKSNYTYENDPTDYRNGIAKMPIFTPIHVDVNIVSNDILDLEKFRAWRPEFADADFILEDGKYICGWAVEKMSKSMFNVVNPDDVVEKYGADTLRLYEMFLGPVEQSKPWDTNGIDGVSRFLKKFWNLFFDGDKFSVSDEQPTADELKSIHKLIKKIGQDIENFSFNTSVAAFMICANELTALKCNKRAVLQDFVIVLSPFAPHIAEELWHQLGNTGTVCDARFPDYNEEYLKERSVAYAISFNGKTRFSLSLPADMPREEVEKTVLAHENSQKWTEGKTPKKIIVVQGKIVNVVI